jgi:hypothetical protein
MKKVTPVIVGTNKNEYGPFHPPILTSMFEGPHGYSNIIGDDEIPTQGEFYLTPEHPKRKSQR